MVIESDEIFRVEKAHDLDRGEITLSGNGGGDQALNPWTPQNTLAVEELLAADFIVII